MRKCEVLADRVSLVVGKGSIVEVDDRQFEIARQFLKPVGEKAEKPKAEPKEAEPIEEVKEEEKPKKKK